MLLPASDLGRPLRRHRFRFLAATSSGLLLGAALLLALILPPPASAAPALLQEKRAELEAVKDRMAALQAEIDRLTAEYAAREAEVAQTKEAIGKAEADIREGERDLRDKKAQLAQRVVGFYKEQHASFPIAVEVIMGAEDVSDAIRTLPFLARIADDDKRLVNQVKGLVAGLAERRRELDGQRLRLEGQMRELAATKEELAKVLTQAAGERERLEAQVTALEEMYALVLKADRYRAAWKGRIAASVLRMARGTCFPVDGPHAFINDWHFPRPDERVHLGTDIMAPFGTRLVAVSDGVISRTERNQTLGGVIIWLRGDNGINYYYAHLQDIAPGIAAGKRVLAGCEIGYVGDSGNAQGGSPHLHFQVHPGGGEPINPYPLLQVSSRVPG
jgi:murein DD-endopeptidase MepM/ murein hydrolase activator NlpD